MGTRIIGNLMLCLMRILLLTLRKIIGLIGGVRISLFGLAKDLVHSWLNLLIGFYRPLNGCLFLGGNSFDIVAFMKG